LPGHDPSDLTVRGADRANTTAHSRQTGINDNDAVLGCFRAAVDTAFGDAGATVIDFVRLRADRRRRRVSGSGIRKPAGSLLSCGA
jgi:hypothetical protein